MPMDFELSDAQREIVEGVRALCARFGDEYWRTKDASAEFPHEFYQAIAKAGYLGIAVPEEFGGSGLGITEAALVMREVAYAGAMNAASSIHLGIFGLTPIIRHGSKEMQRRYLPKAVSGELHTSFAVTEPDAGNDISHIKTFARREGDYYVINGRKVFTTKAQVSTKMMLLTRTTPIEKVTKKTDGMTLFLADIDRGGAVEVRELKKLGRHAVDTNMLFIDNLKVSVADMIGEEGRGFRYLIDGLNPERILIAAEAIGIGRAAVDRAVRYATERIVFGRPIGQNQAIAHPLADAYAKLEVAELMMLKAGWLFDNNKPCGAEANIAKLRAAEAGFEACDRAVQTLGGYGYMREYDVERFFRECRMLKIAPVSQEMVLNSISEHVLHLPRSY